MLYTVSSQDKVKTCTCTFYFFWRRVFIFAAFVEAAAAQKMQWLYLIPYIETGLLFWTSNLHKCLWNFWKCANFLQQLTKLFIELTVAVKRPWVWARTAVCHTALALWWIEDHVPRPTPAGRDGNPEWNKMVIIIILVSCVVPVKVHKK